MKYAFEPLADWTEPPTVDHPWCRFKANYDDTWDLLGRETEKLGATLVVVQIDVTREEIRLDGRPRANARPRTPAVRISFESRHGSLTYATDRFDDWRDNLRAIALSLEALRAVDRYGVNKGGEQYLGFAALTAGPNRDVAAAEDLIASYGGLRDALFKTHPDRGGSDEAFRAVDEARKLLAGVPS